MRPWRAYKLRLFSPLLIPLFHEHSHTVFSMLSQSLITSTSLARSFINLSYVNVLWNAHADYSYFDTCSRLRASVASACNRAAYRTFNVIVLKCTHYISHITLNVLQTGCTIVSELEFKLGSLVWQAGSLPIKPSGPA